MCGEAARLGRRGLVGPVPEGVPAGKERGREYEPNQNGNRLIKHEGCIFYPIATLQNRRMTGSVRTSMSATAAPTTALNHKGEVFRQVLLKETDFIHLQMRQHHRLLRLREVHDVRHGVHAQPQQRRGHYRFFFLLNKKYFNSTTLITSATLPVARHFLRNP